MSKLLTTNSPIPQGDYVVASSTAEGVAYDALCGQEVSWRDVDISVSGSTTNSEGMREGIIVKNNSGVAITPGMALNFTNTTTGFRKTVQACPAGSAIRCYAPGYVRGATSNTIPDQAYFVAVKNGPINMLSDGTAIAAGDMVVVGAASGQVRTNYGLGGGEVYSNVAASAAVASTNVATKFDKSYTFPANSLNAGDTLRVLAQVIATATVSTDTLTLELMLGSVVIGTTGAIDVANNDIGFFQGDIEIRTAGASGTMVAAGIQDLGPPATSTANLFALASTAIDTTATQQLAVRATWSTSNANSCRLDVLNISRLNTTAPGVTAGTAIAAAASGSSVAFRGQANANW